MSLFTAPFNNMWTLKFKAQQTNVGSLSQLPTTAERAVNQIIKHSSDDETVLGSTCSRRLGGAAKHLIGGSIRCICWSTFEFQIPHVTKKQSKRPPNDLAYVLKLL